MLNIKEVMFIRRVSAEAGGGPTAARAPAPAAHDPVDILLQIRAHLMPTLFIIIIPLFSRLLLCFFVHALLACPLLFK